MPLHIGRNLMQFLTGACDMDISCHDFTDFHLVSPFFKTRFSWATALWRGRFPASIDEASVRALKAQGMGPTEIARELSIGRARSTGCWKANRRRLATTIRQLEREQAERQRA